MIQIRAAKKADLAPLQAIETNSFKSDQLSGRSFAEAIKRDHHVLLVAADADDNAVGYALLHFRAKAGHARLYSIAVDERRRGAGIGRDLLAACEAEAGKRDLARLRLEVRSDDPATQAFYQRHGYAARKVLPRYYEDGGEAIQMEKVLPAETAGTLPSGRHPSIVIVVGRAQDRKPIEETAKSLNVRLISAADYLARPEIAAGARQVVNLCPVEDYLSQGYYVSLLAEARAQRAIPNMDTVTGLSWKKLYKNYLGELTALVKDRVPADTGNETGGAQAKITIEIYFGQAEAEWARRMAARAYRLFPAPVLEVMLSKHKNGWQVDYIWPLSTASLSPADMPRFLGCLSDYCQSRRNPGLRRRRAAFDLAILVNPKEAFPPSTEQAIRNFVRAADRQNIQAEVIGPKELDRLTSFDALFIRETTNIDNHTFTFARMAEAEGMPVIDDPVSILRCSNKVYLREAMARAHIATPKTAMITRANMKELAGEMAFPVVLKIPDGSFSRGVFKVNDRTDLLDMASKLFKSSDLLLAQEFLYTEFDWRVGILNKTPLFVCQYFMSKEHWQIYNHEPGQKTGNRAGDFKTFRVEDAPEVVVKTALKAANLIGNGLYGVDLKQTAKGVVVIEVNDNPNIDHGIEDAVLKENLYRTIVEDIVWRLDRKRGK